MSQNPYEQKPSSPNYPGIQDTVYARPQPPAGPNPATPYPSSSGSNPNTPNSSYGPYGNLSTPPPPPPGASIGSNPYDPYAPMEMMSQPPNASPVYPASTPMPRSLEKKNRSKMILVAVIALLVIIGGSVFAVVANNTNTNTMHAHATATAQTQASAQATANAQATATAGPIATATALATSPYPSFKTPALSDSLNSNSSGRWFNSSQCSFTGGSYQVSLAQQGYFQPCPASSTSFNDFALQVNMTITTGDCGGLVFRGSQGNAYLFEVCQNGRYGLFVHKTNGQGGYLINFTKSSNIHMGLNQTNLLAVVVQGWSISMYVNNRNTPIQTITDSYQEFSQGYIGVFADAVNSPTTVAFTNAFVWT